jgi:hypothetical protein
MRNSDVEYHNQGSCLTQSKKGYLLFLCLLSPLMFLLVLDGILLRALDGKNNIEVEIIT